MTNDRTAAVADTTPPSVRRPWNIFMFFVGPLVAYAAMLADRGNGWSPIVFLLFGVVTALVAERWACRGRNLLPQWTRRGLTLAAIAVVSFVAALYSIRLDASAAFVQFLGLPPPAGVRDLRGWKQWYDGQDFVLVFDADLDCVTQICGRATRPLPVDAAVTLVFEEEPARVAKTVAYILATPFFGHGRLALKPMPLPRVWQDEQMNPSPSLQIRSNTLVWEPTTGQAVLIHREH